MPYNALSLPLSLRLRYLKYLALLLTLKFDRCGKPAFSCLCSSWPPSILNPLPLLPSFVSRWRTGTRLRASSSGLGREDPILIRKALTGKQLRENFRKRRSVITVELQRYGIGRLIALHPARTLFADALFPFLIGIQLTILGQLLKVQRCLKVL